MRVHIRKRYTWEFIVDVGRHAATGSRRQKSKSGFLTKRERRAPSTSSSAMSKIGAIPIPDESGSPST